MFLVNEAILLFKSFCCGLLFFIKLEHEDAEKNYFRSEYNVYPKFCDIRANSHSVYLYKHTVFFLFKFTFVNILICKFQETKENYHNYAHGEKEFQDKKPKVFAHVIFGGFPKNEKYDQEYC